MYGSDYSSEHSVTSMCDAQLFFSQDSRHGPIILFYDHDQPYYDLTNFAEYEIVIHGIYYRTLFSIPKVNQDAIS